MHKVVIRPMKEGRYYIQVDDKMMMARSVDVHMDRESIPEIDLELIGEPDIEMEGMVQFSYTPKTITEATNLIKAGLLRNDITAFLAMNTLNKVIEDAK